MMFSRSTRVVPQVDPLLWRWIGPVPGACMLMTTIGALYASGVYVAMIDRTLFTKAMGVSFLSCEIGITASASLLHQAQSERMYRRSPPILGVLCAFFLSLQALMPTALRTNNHALVYTSAISLGLACGGTYVIGLAVLQAWVPESVGTISGVGMCFISAGSFLGVSILRKAMDAFGGPLNAMSAVSIVQSIVVLLFSLLVSCPPRGWHPSWETEGKGTESYDTNVTDDRDEERPLLPTDNGMSEPCDGKQEEKGLSSDVNLSLTEVLTTPSLYPYTLMVVAVMGPATGMSMAFPHMMTVIFGTDKDVANSLLSWVISGGIVGRFLSGIAIDVLEKRSRDGTGLFASRIVCTLSLGIQMISLVLMPIAIQQGLPKLYTLLASAILFSFSAGMVASSCLARSMYTAFNSSVTFNMSGFAVGIVESVYARIIANTNERPDMIGAEHMHGFDSFFTLSLLLCVAGLLACVSFSPCKKAYRKAGLEALLTS